MASSWYCGACLHSFAEDLERCPNLGCRRRRPGAGWGRLYGPGDLLDRTYRIHRMLAVGGAGITYLARETDLVGDEVGPLLAIKVLLAARDQGSYLQRLAMEAQILQGLQHPHVVQGHGFVHRPNFPPYLLMRFAEGGSLWDLVEAEGAWPPADTLLAMRHVGEALSAAHQRGIVHRDLKPQNVLVRDPVGVRPRHLLVGDFGIAKVQGSLQEGLTQAGAFIGTPEFAAPEQFLGQAPTAGTDVFAWALLTLYLAWGRPPVNYPHREDPLDCLQHLEAQLPLRELPRTWPADPHSSTLLAAMTERRPEDRPSAADVLRELQSPTPSRAAAPAAPAGLPPTPASAPNGGHERPAPASSPRPPADLSLEDLFAPKPRASTAQAPTAAPAPPPEPAPEAAPPSPPRHATPEALIRWLASAGGFLPAHQVEPTTLEELRQRLPYFEQSTDPELLTGALLAGPPLGRSVSPLVLRRSLGQSSPAVRCAALAVIGEAPSPSYLPVVKPLLQDADANTRAAAVRAVAAIAEASGQEALARAWLAPLTQDGSPEVRKALAEAARLG